MSDTGVDLRVTALERAVAMAPDKEPAERTVQRAEAFYDFLSGRQAKP